MPWNTTLFNSIGGKLGLICFDLSSGCINCFTSSALGPDTARQMATVDHADMRGLVTDWTSLRRGAGLSLVAGFIDLECPLGVIPLVDAGIARTRVLHTGPTMP